MNRQDVARNIEIGKHLHDDICKECAAELTPWPEGCTGMYHGLCNWCGNADRALMPVAELEAHYFPEEIGNV